MSENGVPDAVVPDKIQNGGGRHVTVTIHQNVKVSRQLRYICEIWHEYKQAQPERRHVDKIGTGSKFNTAASTNLNSI